MNKIVKMKNKVNIKIELTTSEKQKLRSNKVKINDITNFTIDEIEVLIGASFERAREVYALVEFQMIPSIGIKFAEDLVSMGYYSINELEDKDGAKLIEDFELLKGYWIDPCVEDQFRLVVNYANTKDKSKKWWDFTEERKKFRLENGYSNKRPKKAWYDVLNKLDNTAKKNYKMSNYKLKGVPTFRITNYKKAIEFYIDLLGFSIDWEHRFGKTEPVYMQISKNGLVLHLSENKRYKTGVIIFVETKGIEKFRDSILNRKSKNQIPDILTTNWKTKQMEIEDPFENLLRFNES